MVIAKNKLDKVASKLTELKILLQKTVITAPLTGVVMQPEITRGGSELLLHVGKEAKAGALLLTIGDLSGFSINSRVDEVDVTKVKKGQTAWVTGDAFPDSKLKGKVSSLSSEAGKRGFSGSTPSFQLVATVKDIDAKLKKKLLVGMSANLEIIIYKNDNALLLPVESVQMMGEDTAMVNRKNEDQVSSEMIEVQVGRTTFDSVEILNGLKEGETVVY